MTEEIISWSISTKVWDWAGIELVTPGSTGSLLTALWGLVGSYMSAHVLMKLINEFG